MTRAPKQTAMQPDTPLHDGEVLLTKWTPSFHLFAYRALLLGLVTALFLSPLGLLVWWQWMLVVPVLTVIYIFIFDDFSTWVRHREDTWYMTNQRLIYENADSPENDAALQLPEIDWVRPWFWWALRIGLTNGTGMVMRFVRNPRGIGQQLLAARDALEGLRDD